tara:strand:+ start:1723 stop:1911 length:189 start_codon:yes stop_codon:yes gene_type:complete
VGIVTKEDDFQRTYKLRVFNHQIAVRGDDPESTIESFEQIAMEVKKKGLPPEFVEVGKNCPK